MTAAKITEYNLLSCLEISHLLDSVAESQIWFTQLNLHNFTKNVQSPSSDALLRDVMTDVYKENEEFLISSVSSIYSLEYLSPSCISSDP